MRFCNTNGPFTDAPNELHYQDTSSTLAQPGAESTHFAKPVFYQLPVQQEIEFRLLL
jgi:hypothetical protein